VLRGLGVKTVEFDFPGLQNAADLGSKILLAEAYAYHKDNLEKTPEKYDLSFRERVLGASRHSDADLQEAQMARAELKEQYAALFRSGIDVIASPCNDGTPDSMESLCSNRTSLRGGFASTRLYNMSGMPALAMPMGKGVHGMPLGIQFAANLFAEDRIYQIAAAYEAATPWVARHPKI
jgi:aspartyl-tRNA(Asn)/glutamyl-tRNA(Gln) amidotransferase subunit A